MLPSPSRLKSLASELSPVFTTPPPVEPNTVFVLMSVPEMMLSSNLVVLRRRAANSAAMPARIASAPPPIAQLGVFAEELLEEPRRLLGRRLGRGLRRRRLRRVDAFGGSVTGGLAAARRPWAARSPRLGRFGSLRRLGFGGFGGSTAAALGGSAAFGGSAAWGGGVVAAVPARW